MVFSQVNVGLDFHLTIASLSPRKHLDLLEFPFLLSVTAINDRFR
jgi:hypothetical protein